MTLKVKQKEGRTLQSHKKQFEVLFLMSCHVMINTAMNVFQFFFKIWIIPKDSPIWNHVCIGTGVFTYHSMDSLCSVSRNSAPWHGIHPNAILWYSTCPSCSVLSMLKQYKLVHVTVFPYVRCKCCNQSLTWQQYRWQTTGSEGTEFEIIFSSTMREAGQTLPEMTWRQCTLSI